jgi:hypothetical protein
MNPILANLIGYFYAVVFAQFLIAPIQNRLWRDLISKSGMPAQKVRPRPWHATVVGYVERTVYVAALQASAASLIGVWLALKVASQWKGWSEGLKEDSDSEPKITGREFANVFITGTGLSLVFALAASRCIPHLGRAEWLKAMFLIIAPVIGAAVLYMFICRQANKGSS